MRDRRGSMDDAFSPFVSMPSVVDLNAGAPVVTADQRVRLPPKKSLESMEDVCFPLFFEATVAGCPGKSNLDTHATEAGDWCQEHLPSKKEAFMQSGQFIATSPPEKVAFWKGFPLISGKSRLMKYYNLARRMVFFL